MANIVLARIDSRLIHGQVIAKWMKRYPAKKIVIVDEELSKDSFMSEIYMMAAPKGVKVEILNSDIATNRLNEMDDDVLLLFKNIDNCYKACVKGLDISHLIIGGVPGAPGKKAIASGVYLDKKDVETLNELNKLSISIAVRVIPEESEVSLEKINKIVK